MEKLKWKFSYTTYKFDTPDGAIHPGEYAITNDDLAVKDGSILIPDPEGKWDFIRVHAESVDLTGMTEVHVIGERAFDIFYDETTGETHKDECSLQDYRALAVKGAGPRVKFKP